MLTRQQGNHKQPGRETAVLLRQQLEAIPLTPMIVVHSFVSNWSVRLPTDRVFVPRLKTDGRDPGQQALEMEEIPTRARSLRKNATRRMSRASKKTRSSSYP